MGTSTTGARRASLRRILSQRSAVIGLVIIGFLFTIAIGADFIATHPPNDTMLRVEEGARPRQAPCIHILGCPADQPQHLLGLDGNARDVFSRIVHGSRTSLVIGFVTVAAAIVIGTLIGAVAGFLSNRTDGLLMRSMDVLLAFPALLLALVIVTVLKPTLFNAMIAVAIVSIPIYARVMRASVLSVREQDYVTAARALGDSSFNILRRRVMPNAITPLIVTGTLGIGTAVLEVAALSFLGLAAQPPLAEWGTMIGNERNQLFSAPWLIIAPGVMLTLTVLGFNLLGDGLRDALDPRLSR
ncbi:MAG TPA: ABC transporter permease [Candidatus Limnocylindrales bacterium]|nr:ABC transporter permease [Candidatus Limnocylindrales bacterium]